MDKLIINDWDWRGDQPLRIMKRSDKDLVKEAQWYLEYKSEPGFTFVNALFLGAGESYGCNKNGDFFEEDELLNHYKSFLQGNHFKHHQNDNPENSYGKVVQVFYNSPMHRVEGIIKIINDRSPDMIEKIEQGLPIPLSMACKVPYDICSICGHKSKVLAEYCDDLKYDMCTIRPDGKLVCAKNPRPNFFDISEVARGADKTAFTLRKVASHGSITVARNDMDKLAILERLAAIEKHINMITQGKPLEKSSPAIGGKDNTKASSFHSNGSLKIAGKAVLNQERLADNIKAAELAHYGAAYSVKDFGHTGIAPAFQTLLEHPDRDKILEKISSISYTFLDNNDKEYKLQKRSLLTNLACDRMQENSSATVHIVTEPVCNKDILTKVAAFNLAIICSKPDLLSDSMFTKLMVLQNCIQ